MSVPSNNDHELASLVEPIAFIYRAGPRVSAPSRISNSGRTVYRIERSALSQLSPYRKYQSPRLVSAVQGADDNSTIGLVLCSEKSEAVVKYSVLSEQKQLFSAKYLPYLPSEEELKQELERERAHAIAQLTAKENDDE